MAISHLPARAGASMSVLGEVNTLKVRHAAYTIFESSAAPGGGLPPHAHEEQDEAIYVLDGEYQLASGEERLPLVPGSLAFVPRGTVHCLTVTGRRPGRCLVAFNPPGAMERFFDEVRTMSDGDDGGAPVDGTDPVDGVLAIARRLGITLLTSPV